jgi:hypothetical protein
MDKMSDVFKLPLYIGYDDAIYGNDKIEVGEFIQCQQDEAAVLAINAYPAMLEALEKIHKIIAKDEIVSGRECLHIENISQQAIKLAKGEA